MPLEISQRPRHGLLLGFALVLLLIGAAHLAVEAFLNHERRQAEDAGFAEAGRDAEAARLTVLRTLDAVEALGQLVRERQLLVERGNREGAAAMEALARTVATRRAFGILQVSAIAPDGRVAWSSVEGWQPVDLSDRPHIRTHMPDPGGGPPPDRLFISEPLVGRVSNLQTLQASRPVYAADGSFAGISVISLDPLDLAQLLGELLPDDRGVISIIRNDGTFLSRSREPTTSIGRRLNPTSPTMRMVEAGEEGNLRTRGSLGGRDILAALRRLPGTPLYVAANMDVGLVQTANRRLEALLRAGEVALGLLLLGALGLHQLRHQRERYAQARATAEAMQRQLAQVLEGLPGSAYRAELGVGGQFRFLYASSSVTELTGLSCSQMQGLPAWLARIEAAEPPEAIHGLHARAAREGRQTVDVLFRRPDGVRRWLRITVQPVRQHADGQIELVGYLADITEQREALSAMVNSAKLATLGEMATGLAHELNQPVSIMALAAENTARALRRHGAEAIPDALQRMERIGSLAQRAKGIIDHLRAFGRTDPGPLEPISVQEAVAGATLLVGAALREAEVTVVLDLPDGLPRVRGRLLLLEQVLINLLLNARDALLEGRAAVRRITVAARLAEDPAAGQCVLLTVADSGPGIPAEVLPRLFEPFFTTKPTGQGTGLGLSLCHGIMRSLGGTISAANRQAGQGGAESRLQLQPAAAPMPAAVPAATGA
ncbi:ATP-binding protein [Dankookia sp. P2]|uniref:ATP-binding protein n=1 Tax=Dankookia sp. P2 TaxID=3423955 RepID=UPI003D66E196